MSIRPEASSRRIIKTTFVVCILIAASGGSAFAGPFEDGIAALDRRDFAIAFILLRPLAEQGNPEAQIDLGNMYFDGNGVPLDYAQAVKWYLAAAEQGSADAQITLGFLYEYGDAVPQDFVQAHKWFDLAGQDTYRETIAARMTPEQIAEAQKLARDWKPNQQAPLTRSRR